MNIYVQIIIVLYTYVQETANYAGSNVLILGGGDGALLKELMELPTPPAKV